MDTCRTSPEELVGTFRTFGGEGPIYEVLQTIEPDTLRIVLVETGEKVEYSLQEALSDPEAK